MKLVHVFDYLAFREMAMKKYCGVFFGYFALMLALLLASCGGGGGGGGDSSPRTTEGSTPIDANNESSVNGRYDIVRLQYFFSNGDHFDSDDLDEFGGSFVIDYPGDRIEFEMEWHDSEYGDFEDFDIDKLSNADDLDYESYYYTLDDDYTITIFYKNLCYDVCFDAKIKLRKLSDSTESLI